MFSLDNSTFNYTSDYQATCKARYDNFLPHFSDALTKQNGVALTRSHILLSHFFSDLADFDEGLKSWLDALRLRETLADSVFLVVEAWLGEEPGEAAAGVEPDGTGLDEADMSGTGVAGSVVDCLAREERGQRLQTDHPYKGDKVKMAEGFQRLVSVVEGIFARIAGKDDKC